MILIEPYRLLRTKARLLHQRYRKNTDLLPVLETPTTL